MYRFFGKKQTDNILKSKEFIKKFIDISLLDTKDLDIPYTEAISILENENRTESQNKIIAELVDYYFEESRQLKKIKNKAPIYQQLSKIYEENAQELYYKFLFANEGIDTAEKYRRNLLIKGKSDIIDWSNSDNFIFQLQNLGYSDDDIQSMLLEYYSGDTNWSEILKFYEKKYGVNKS